MTHKSMTHEYAMLGVLKLGPVNRTELQSICGWNYGEVDDTLKQLVKRGDVKIYGGHMVRRYVSIEWIRKTLQQPAARQH